MSIEIRPTEPQLSPEAQEAADFLDKISAFERVAREARDAVEYGMDMNIFFEAANALTTHLDMARKKVDAFDFESCDDQDLRWKMAIIAQTIRECEQDGF
jgi:hypothetical protein